jgi:hypothetical protein
MADGGWRMAEGNSSGWVWPSAKAAHSKAAHSKAAHSKAAHSKAAISEAANGRSPIAARHFTM